MIQRSRLESDLTKQEAFAICYITYVFYSFYRFIQKGLFHRADKVESKRDKDKKKKKKELEEKEKEKEKESGTDVSWFVGITFFYWKKKDLF